MPPRKPSTRRKKVAARSKGLSAAETASAPDTLDRLAAEIEGDDGAVLARYRDPVGGTPLLLVSLPIERVEPTPYQRDPSDPHVKRLMGVIEKKTDDFLDVPVAKALEERKRRGKRVLRLDDAVSAVVEKLKKKGFTSPYLRAFVMSRVNYTRFSKAPSIAFDEAFDKITASAEKFNIERVKQEDVARSGGGPREEDE